MPSAWGKQNNVNDEKAIPVIYDFKQVTPVKKFKPSHLKKQVMHSSKLTKILIKR